MFSTAAGDGDVDMGLEATWFIIDEDGANGVQRWDGQGLKGSRYTTLDFSAGRPDGSVWDFSRREDQGILKHMLQEARPTLSVGGAVQGKWEELARMRTIDGRGGKDSVTLLNELMEHDIFLAEVYGEQQRKGRQFCHKFEPRGAGRRSAIMWTLEEDPKCIEAEAKEAHVKRAILTNSTEIAEAWEEKERASDVYEASRIMAHASIHRKLKEKGRRTKWADMEEEDIYARIRTAIGYPGH